MINLYDDRNAEKTLAMKIKLVLIIALNLLVLLVSCRNRGRDCGAGKKSAEITNPLPMKLGDPYLLRTKDGNYYLYGTSLTDGFEVFMTSNFEKWQDCGQVYKEGGGAQWNSGSFWAPEVFERNEKYYLFYSANDRSAGNGKNYKIGVAVSLSPIGPFSDLYGRPIFDPGYPTIDADVYFDDIGRRTYLYYTRYSESKTSGNQIYGVEMKPDFSGVIGIPRLLLSAPANFAQGVGKAESAAGVEAPHVFKSGKVYYLIYSTTNDGSECTSMEYAMAMNPMGPYKRAGNNPILCDNKDGSGTLKNVGHGMMIAMPGGDFYCVYHARLAQSPEDKAVLIDKLLIGNDSRLSIDGPTIDAQQINY